MPQNDRGDPTSGRRCGLVGSAQNRSRNQQLPMRGPMKKYAIPPRRLQKFCRRSMCRRPDWLLPRKKAGGRLRKIREQAGWPKAGHLVRGRRAGPSRLLELALRWESEKQGLLRGSNAAKSRSRGTEMGFEVEERRRPYVRAPECKVHAEASASVRALPLLALRLRRRTTPVRRLREF